MGRKRSIIRTVSAVAVAGGIAILLLVPRSGLAQSTSQSGALSQTLQSILATPGMLPVQGAPQTVQPSVTSQQTVIAPSVQQSTAQSYVQPQSRLEQIMSQRAGAALYQFGYNLLGQGQSVVATQVGEVQDYYILGPGDLIDIAMRGQNTSEYRVTVDRDGRAIVPGVAPVAASGRRFGDFKADLINAIHKAFVATDAYVSVAQVRQVNVLVTGEVNNPGLRTLTALSTPLDAILVSGGVQKVGSLRNVKIMRGNQEIPYDLYDVITQHGHLQPITLADGDRIIVPPLGATVAVTGWARVPGIYELPGGASGLTARSLIALAGGLEVRGSYRLVVMRLGKDGRQQISELPNEGAMIRDSDVLYAEPAASEVVGGTTLAGGQTMAGQYSISRAQKLSGLLRAPGAMGDSPYALFGIVVRRDPHTYVKSLVAFSPAAVLEGVDDIDLTSSDIVRVFSNTEAAMLLKTIQDYQTQQQTTVQYQQNPQLASQISTGGYAIPTTFGAPGGVSAAGAPVNGQTQSSPNSYAPNTNSSSLLNNQAAMNLAGTPVQSLTGAPQTMPAPQFQGTATPQTIQNPIAQFSSLQTQGAPLGMQPPIQQPPIQQPMIQQPMIQQPTIVGGVNLDLETVANPPPVATNAAAQNFTQVATQLGIDPQVLINFLLDHQARIDGAVRGPGVYLVGPHVNLKDLVGVAGGISNWADESGVELLSTALDSASGRATTQRQVLPLREAALGNYMVQPRDQIRFNQIYSSADGGTITLADEVRSPGTYPIMHGEHLSQVLVRAGGLTDAAYPYGTVFLRQSVAALEEIGFQKTADEVQKQFFIGASYAASSGANAGASMSLTDLSLFIARLRQQKPLGRISLQADPSVLAAHPDQDPMLEQGDYIFIPQRPSSVTVLGDVSQPGSYPFNPKNSAQDYINLAGGISTYADAGWTYIVYPDGSAQQLDSSSWFSFGNKEVPPGSVIYVPRDLLPINWQVLLTNTAEIFKDLALSAASLAVLSKSNTTVK